jgi:hypothetical protein
VACVGAAVLGGLEVSLARSAGAPPALVSAASASTGSPSPTTRPVARPTLAGSTVRPRSRVLTQPGAAAQPASDGLAESLDRAARLAVADGLRAGIAVFDTATGRLYRAGQADARFGTASVVKVLIAAYLLANHEMTGPTADLAYSMITRSDDDAATILWQQVGGPALEPWIEQHFGVPGLGSPNTIPGRWGNTHVTPSGLVRLYAKLRTDPAVWPWLGDAMRHLSPIAKDGTDQTFGLPAVARHAPVKQGWAAGSADDPADAVVNTTGYLDRDRYAVAILTEGAANNDTTDSRGLNPAQAAVVTAMARTLGPIAR